MASGADPLQQLVHSALHTPPPADYTIFPQRIIPRPARFFGGQKPAADRYPFPRFMPENAPLCKQCFVLFSAELGYEVCVTRNVGTWIGRLRINKRGETSGQRCAMSAGEIVKRCTIYNEYMRQRAALIQDWQAHYGMHTRPTALEMAGDLALLIRWLFDSYEFHCNVGLASTPHDEFN